MTNEDKNEKRFDELGLGDLPTSEIAHHIAVMKNGEVDLCAQIPCHDCIFFYGNCDKKCQEWLADEAEPDKTAPEEKEKMEKDEIKVGDTVKVTTICMREGEIGTVRSIRRLSSGLNLYGVSFDRDGRGRAFLEREIEKVKVKKTPPRIVIYQSGDTVTARDLETGEEASAVCSKDDTFDFHIGAFIAMSRLAGYADMLPVTMGNIELMEREIADFKNIVKAMMGCGDMRLSDDFFLRRMKSEQRA